MARMVGQVGPGMGGPGDPGAPPPGISQAQHEFLSAASGLASLADIPPGAPPMPPQGITSAIADVQKVMDGLANVGLNEEETEKARKALQALQKALTTGNPDLIREAARAPLDGMHKAVGGMVQALTKQASAGLGGPPPGGPGGPGAPPPGISQAQHEFLSAAS